VQLVNLTDIGQDRRKMIGDRSINIIYETIFDTLHPIRHKVLQHDIYACHY